MKKIVLLSLVALALCVFPTNMRAENVCHAIGSATTTAEMPKSDSHSSTFQMIFTKEELLAAGVQPGYIGSIKFNWLGTNNTSKELEIYMASTAKSVFANRDDYEPAATFTTARGYYYEDIPWSTINGEKTYTFNSPFVWDGYSNIVIATIVNGDAGNNHDINFTARGSDCGANRCIWDSGPRHTDEFSVGCFGNGHLSTFRPVISFCQDNMTCPNVTNVAASNVTINSASITWDAASCTDGYDVAYSTSPVTDFSTATIQHVTTNSINLTDLSDDTDYYVYVRARCTVFSDWSQALYFKTLFDCSAPENVAITDIGKYRMTLNWTTSPKATSYDIIVSTTELADPSSADVTYANVTGTSKVFDNLRRETTYHVYIRANCSENGYSDWTHLSATTLSLGYDCSRDTDYVYGTGNDWSYLVHHSYSCSYTQQIYTADELHALGFTEGPIKAVEFDFKSNDYGDEYNKIQSVYIGTTDKDIFSSTGADNMTSSPSEFVTGLTRVYGPAERSCPRDGGWLRYGFNIPFNWDGESNIVIGFLSDKVNDDTNTNGWGANGTSLRDNDNQYIYNAIITCGNDPIDINNIINKVYRNPSRSNIKFVSCPDSIPCPEFKKAPVASNITHNAATITWHVDQEDHTSYDMIVSDEEIADFTNVTPTESGITATSYNLVQLAPETDYYVYVRANYVNGDISECTSQWSPVCEFQTDVYCKMPYDLSVTNIAERTATLNWNVTDNTATSFDLVVSKEPLADPSTGTILDITATNNGGVYSSYLDHLTHNTHYYLYIRTDCVDGTSLWSSVEFNTLPIFDCNNTHSWLFSVDYTSYDSHFPVMSSIYDLTQKTQSIYSVSMLSGLLKIGDRINKLKYFVESGGSMSDYGNWGNATFNIRMMATDQSTLSSGFVSTANATLVYSGTLSANVQNGMEITLTEPFDYTGGNLLIEFELPTTVGLVYENYYDCNFYGSDARELVSYIQYYNYVRMSSHFLPMVEFSICEKAPACPEVANVAATNIGETSAIIKWTATGTYANTSDIYYSTTPVEDFTDIEPQITDITGDFQQITGLAPYTIYYVYVRTHCDAQGYDDGISGWADALFRTLPLCRIPGTLKATITDKHDATVTWTNTSGIAQQANNFTYIFSTTPIAEEDLDNATTKVTGLTTTSVSWNNLQSEMTYYFYVKNVCTGDLNCSSPWDSCQFTMPAEMPAVINLQAHDIAHNAFTATWESDIANFASETEWEVACVVHGTQPTTWTPVSVPEYFAFGLEDNTTYDFYVRAKSGNNYSANAMIEVTTIQKNTDDCKDVVIRETYSVSEVPVFSNFMGSYTVQIYTAEQLREFGCTDAGNIKKIAFYQTNCRNTSDASCYRKSTTVWMGNTTKGTFDNNNDWITGLTKVMDEKPVDFNKNGDWVELQFDESFYWNGESNLAVAVLAYSDGYTKMNFAGGSVTGDRSLYAYKDEDSWSVTDGVPSYLSYVYTASQLANIKLCFELASCTPVANLRVDNITTTMARAHWYPGDNETTWHVYNSNTELTDDELDALDQAQQYTVVNSNPEYNLTGLTKETDYYLYVRAACGADDVSRWRHYKYSTLPTCSAPAEAIATTDNNSITFTVNPGEEREGIVGTYDYRYWIAGSNDIVTESGKTSPFTVSGLSGDKDYEWEVRANCSGTGEGSSRWVKGNTVHVCGVVDLPYFNDFEQYELLSVPVCWTATKEYRHYNIKYPLVSYGSMAFFGNSAIATPSIDVPAEGLKISFQLSDREGQVLKVMFTTNLTADESTYTTIATLSNDDGTNDYSNRVVLFNPEAATSGYIVFSKVTDDVLDCKLDNLLIEAKPTSDTKDVTVDKVTYTISGLLQGNDVTIEKVSFDEDDLTEADFDITYYDGSNPVSTYLNYKHKLDIPSTLTDIIRYKVVDIKADAFNDITLVDNVRVNIPAGMEVVGMPENNKIVVKDSETGILYNGNSYTASKAYKVNVHGADATLTQRPFDNQPLQITYTDGNDTETEIDNTNVYKTEGAIQFKYEEGAWDVNDEPETGTFEASLRGDEVTIDVGRSNTIRVANNAQYNGTFDLTFCNELKIQADNVNRSYPDCQLTGNMPLGDDTKVKAELSLNNKEYYYFSLPFDCNVSDIQLMAGTDVVERSSSIDEALKHEDNVNRYVLFRWNESAYTSDETNGYVEFSGTMLEKNKGYVIAIVESDEWYRQHENDYDESSLDVTATFTAGDDYSEIASSASEMEIPVTRADAMNLYSGWNLVGNPFYGSVMSSQYSFNKYVRKVESDNGEKAVVNDYAADIPVLNAEIKPFETVFIQKSDAAGDGTVTVTGTSPVQRVQGVPAILPEYVTIILSDSSRMMDRTTIVNNELSSDDFLQEEDLVKSHQNSNEIYTEYGDFDFSFNEMNIIDADKTIPLAVKVAAEGDYTIAMSSELSSYPTGYVFLHDKTLETYMKLSDGEVETLHLTEGVTEGRLEIVIKVEEVIVEPDNTEDVSEDGIATIEGIEVGAMVTIVDATGKTLYTAKATGDRMDYQFAVRGVYMITIRNNTKVNTVKVIY